MHKIYKKEKIKIIKPVLATSSENITSVKKRTGCDCIINGGIYTFADRTIDSQVRIDGVNYGQYTTFGFAIDNGNHIYWDSGLTNITAPYFIGEYGILIENGIITNTLQGYNRNNVTERTAIGITKDNDLVVYLATGTEKCKTNALAERMKSFGCVYAINLDGGGSTQGIFSDGYKYLSGRKVVWYICIWLEKEENKEGEYMSKPYYNDSKYRLSVYETTKWDKKIGTLDPYERCECIAEGSNYAVVKYYITGTQYFKVGFVKEVSGIGKQ